MLLLLALLAAAAPEIPVIPVPRRLNAAEQRFVAAANRLAEAQNAFLRPFAAGATRDLRLERKLVRALHNYEKLLLPADPDDFRTGPELCPAK